MYPRFFKRFFDILCAALAILIASPVMLVLSVWIKADSAGPVFFRQKRIGKGKTTFEIVKFRTMYADTPKDVPTHQLQNADARITKVGRFLRRSSLDELPQLFNIFVGQMSFVGPRPALWNQYDLIAQRDLYSANDVVPGLTGLAQVSGRDELPIPIKAKYDGEYAKRITFFGDIGILFRTFFGVLRADGVVEGEQQPKEKGE